MYEFTGRGEGWVAGLRVIPGHVITGSVITGVITRQPRHSARDRSEHNGLVRLRQVVVGSSGGKK
eukprot:6140403-Prymnesium_polylepis.1